MEHVQHNDGQNDEAARKKVSGARSASLVTVAQLPEFDEVIDARSESEFAEDHIVGSINCPSLNDAERERVGTIHKQASAFDANKIGAALVSANISRHLQERFMDRPRTWRPLVYCWRGGSRSGALAHVLAQIGWKTGRLDGGYRAYRRTVIADLESVPPTLDLKVVCGMTGTGKSRLLRAIAGAGGQVLDLEALAAHRGSVLGNLPDAPQPSQKMFESRIWHALRTMNPHTPIHVEAESKRIGRLRVPEALIARMWASPCLRVEAPMHVRIAILKEEYSHFLTDAELLLTQLGHLVTLHGHERLDRWKQLAGSGQWDMLVEELLLNHYDPAYLRSTVSHYPTLDRAEAVSIRNTGDEAMAAAARECVERAGQTTRVLSQK